MVKYIDAEKLIAEIEQYKQGAAIARFDNAGENADYFQGKVDLCDDLTHIVASLQQDKETLELCAKIWWEEQGWIMIPPDVTVEGIESLLKQVRKILQQEQPEVDLASEIEAESKRYPEVSYAKLSRIAKRFYELGRARKEE